MYKEHAGGGARDIPGWEIQKSFDYIASICKYILATVTLSILFHLVLLLLITIIVIISVVIVIDRSVRTYTYDNNYNINPGTHYVAAGG